MWGTTHFETINNVPTAMNEFYNHNAVKLSNLFVKHVCLGHSHYALTTGSGELYTWGEGKDGQLGHGSFDDIRHPTQIASVRYMSFKSISCNLNISMALSTDGRIYAWGGSSLGVLGLGTIEKGPKVAEPRIIEAFQGEKMVAICTSGTHSIALSKDGNVFTWGFSITHCLGHEDDTDKWTPTILEALQGKSIQHIACGSSHMAVTITHGWLEDSETSACMNCREPFTFVKRRHHCRYCGMIFCNDCSLKRFPILSMGFTQPVRVCEKCYNALSSNVSTTK